MHRNLQNKSFCISLKKGEPVAANSNKFPLSVIKPNKVLRNKRQNENKNNIKKFFKIEITTKTNISFRIKK